MKNLELEKNFLFIGDKSRYIFAKTITGLLPPDYENFTLLFEHGDTLSKIKSRENLFNIASFKTPPGMKISLMKSDESWKESFTQFSRIFLFEEFPLKKDSTQQLINTWNNLPKNRPPLTVVIMDLAHRQSSTDLDRLDDAVIEAQKNYTSQGLEVVFFRSSADMINILHRHESILQQHKKILSRDLEKIYDRMYELEFLYEDFIMDCNDAGGCLSLSTLNKICSFESVKLSNKSSFWNAYNDAALKRLFPSDTFSKGNFNDLIKICHYILTGDFEVKNSSPKIEQTKLELNKVLRKIFLLSMSDRTFSGTAYAYESKDILAYKKSTSDKNGRFYGINAEYGRQFRRFVEKDAKDILKSALESYINFFEEVIK